MSRRRLIGIALFSLSAMAGVALYWSLRTGRSVPAQYDDAARPPSIDPDYAGCTVPPNIAPLNFVVRETAAAYCVRVYSDRGEAFVVSGPSPKIVMPMDKWRALLDVNRGKTLHFDIYARGGQGRWRRFATITNTIAREDVDSHVAYRRIKPVHTIYTHMGIYQRDVRTYRESPVLLSGPDSHRCVNCHTFVNNNPDTLCLHTRGPGAVAMILARNGRAKKINTRTGFNASPASYTAWHPSGRVAAFAAIRVIQFHHAVGNSRGVLDLASDVGIYVVETNSVTSTPAISRPDRLETFPTWSPDGKYLYYCSAEKLWTAEKGVPASYHRVRYDLMRIRYNLDAGTCGKPETVLSAKDTNLSINEPRISPDGRFLLFCMADHGSFPVFQQSSDLYMMNLASGRYWPLEINSDRSDSWHGWSTNSRWIVFASKRGNGLFGRLYFSYVDIDGKAHKPVLLPQRDPAFYDDFLDNFNAPELITKPISVKQAELLRAIESADKDDAAFAGMLPGAGADDDSTTDAGKTTPWQPQKALATSLSEAHRYYRLAEASEKEGKIEQAVEHYRQAVRYSPRGHPSNALALNRLAWIYATNTSERLRNGGEATSMALHAAKIATLQAKRSRDARVRKSSEAMLPSLMDTLAAAHAECDRFTDAVRTALEAETLALRQGQVDLAVRIRHRLELYLVHKPCRSPRPD